MGKIILNGSPVGTAVLLSADVMLTCEHCLDDENAASYQIEFGQFLADRKCEYTCMVRQLVKPTNSEFQILATEYKIDYNGDIAFIIIEPDECHNCIQNFMSISDQNSLNFGKRCYQHMFSR
jgi:hypothetical protein